MNNILVIAAAAFAVVSCDPVQPCSDLSTFASQCLSSNGLDMSDIQKFSQGGSIDPEVIRKQCNHLPQYLKAYQCVSSEFSRCSETGIKLPPVEQMTQTMNLFCNDSSLRYDCISQVQQQSSQVQSCVISHIGSINSQSQTTVDMPCEYAKISVKCVVDLVTECDTHTANVVAQMGQITTSHFCDATTTR